MTDQELTAYFKTANLPGTLRINRATTQHDVTDAVKRNLEQIMADPKDLRSRYRLTQIWYALENPYNGPEIPRF